jgi:hypothetical protein
MESARWEGGGRREGTEGKGGEEAGWKEGKSESAN